MVNPLWQLFDGSCSGQDVHYTKDNVHVRLDDNFGRQVPKSSVMGNLISDLDAMSTMHNSQTTATQMSWDTF